MQATQWLQIDRDAAKSSATRIWYGIFSRFQLFFQNLATLFPRAWQTAKAGSLNPHSRPSLSLVESSRLRLIKPDRGRNSIRHRDLSSRNENNSPDSLSPTSISGQRFLVDRVRSFDCSSASSLQRNRPIILYSGNSKWGAQPCGSVPNTTI